MGSIGRDRLSEEGSAVQAPNDEKDPAVGRSGEEYSRQRSKQMWRPKVGVEQDTDPWQGEWSKTGSDL